MLSGEGDARRGGARERRGASSTGFADDARRRRGLPRRLLPVRRRRGQGVLRGAEGASVTPDVIFTHQRADLHQDHRADLRADLEHVPRPPDPRVRDPEVRRRPRARRTSFVHARARRSPSARSTLLIDALRDAARRSTGSPRTCSARCCGCAAWSATRRRAHAEAFYCRKAGRRRDARRAIDGVQRDPAPAHPRRARDDLPHAARRRSALHRSSARSTSRPSTPASSRAGTSTAR